MVGAPEDEGLAFDPVEAVAVSLVRLGTTTLATRLFAQVVLPELRFGRLSPKGGVVVARVLGLAGVPERDHSSQASALRERAVAALRAGAAAGLRSLTIADPAYPDLLRRIDDPPVVLWTRGDPEALAQQPAVAVVGSRNATPEGLVCARRLARGLSEAGVLVVSGLARGIDAAAHRGALDRDGRTVAVLGNGADRTYPAAHGGLAAELVARGCLVSEYPPGTPPLPRHFPLRNRIISGLCRAVVVVQASDRSGSLITARTALDQGREVLAVPGGVASGCHRGCHALIKDGARLVETVEDILEELGWRRPTAVPEGPPGKPQQEQGLAAALRPGAAVSLDDLAGRTGRSAPELLAELTRLELAGVVARLPGGAFVRLD
jgi:DNA processing protein